MRFTLPLFLLLACGWFTSAAEPPAGSVLHLTNESFVAGGLRGSNDAAILRWRSPHFTNELEFPLSSVNAVHYALAAQQPRPQGEYCFELADDDVLYGDLLGMSGDELEIEAARLGRVWLRRDAVRRLYRWQGADSVYLGPNGLAGWKEAVAKQWHDEGGQLFTEARGASLFADLGIPEKAMLEVELSWKKKPDFVLAVGVDESDASLGAAFHLEVWDDELVLVGESSKDADVASVRGLSGGEGSIRLKLYLDQKERRLILLSPRGNPLVTLNVDAGKKSQILPGLRLLNKKGDVRLEFLRVTRWNRLPPREVRDDPSRVHRVDGSIAYGRLSGYDAQKKEFRVRDGKDEVAVPREQLADVVLGPTPAEFIGPPAPGASGPMLRVVYHDGSRYSGAVVRLEHGHVTLASTALSPKREREKNDAAEPIRLPLTGLRSLVVVRRGPVPEAKAVAGRSGRLELEGTQLKGLLVDAVESADARRLVWQPDLGRNAVALSDGLSGRIVYRMPLPPRPAKPATPQPVQRQGGVADVFSTVVQNLTTQPPPPTGQPSLHLRTGDTIPCQVTGIDEQGVHFKTAVASGTFVPHEKIKCVELVGGEVRQLDDVKRDRLLTLPRMQRDSPPTQLICSRNGDFLRARILEMDAKTLKVEVRLETRVIPRERVAQIIWLHADELGDRKPEGVAAQPEPKNRVQAVRADGNRVTFALEKSDHKAVAGTSDVLGACRAELAELDQLLFGSSIEQSAAQLAFHRWKLHHATEPKFVKDDDTAAERITGTESPLIGQPGFAFKLDMLDGSEYQLARHKGRVVVLEFWATWCGPCLHSMPLVEAVVRDFAGDGVELLCVNMEEQAEQIKAMLERHKLKMPVALDRDGVVAARYAVTAIPQTVVIDKEGKIVRLFIGGGKPTAEALKKALQELTGAKPPDTPQPIP